MLKGGVGCENAVVGFYNRVRHLRGGIHRELELGLLAVIAGKPLEQESTLQHCVNEVKPRIKRQDTNKATTSTTAKGVENEEALEARAVVCKTADFLHDTINQFLADRVVSTSV